MVFVAVCPSAHARHRSQRRSSPGPGRIRVGEPEAPASVSITPRRGGGTVSNLNATIATARPGTVIHLASGNYPLIVDETAHAGWVTISGSGDRTPPVIGGADLFGAQHLRLDDLKFSAEVQINHSPIRQAQRADHVQILNSEITCGSNTDAVDTIGVLVRGASRAVTLAGDYVHNCVTGFGSVPQDITSVGIRIVHSTFAHFPGDAIDLGGLAGVVIDHDIIKDIADPDKVHHDDGIQFFGNMHDVRITNNVLANSRNQLILIQDAYGGSVNRSSLNSDILVAHNLIYGAGSVAVQDQGGLDVDFVGNTMWSNFYGSLWIVKSADSGRLPTGTVIVDNIIQGFLEYETGPIMENHNLIDEGALHTAYGPEDLINVDPQFADPRTGLFGLQPRSPAARAGVTYSDALTGTRLADDAFGVAVPAAPAIGMFQGGDPTRSYGVPMYGSDAVA